MVPLYSFDIIEAEANVVSLLNQNQKSLLQTVLIGQRHFYKHVIACRRALHTSTHYYIHTCLHAHIHTFTYSHIHTFTHPRMRRFTNWYLHTVTRAPHLYYTVTFAFFSGGCTILLVIPFKQKKIFAAITWDERILSIKVWSFHQFTIPLETNSVVH